MGDASYYNENQSFRSEYYFPMAARRPIFTTPHVALTLCGDIEDMLYCTLCLPGKQETHQIMPEKQTHLPLPVWCINSQYHWKQALRIKTAWDLTIVCLRVCKKVFNHINTHFTKRHGIWYKKFSIILQIKFFFCLCFPIRGAIFGKRTASPTDASLIKWSKASSPFLFIRGENISVCLFGSHVSTWKLIWMNNSSERNIRLNQSKVGRAMINEWEEMRLFSCWSVCIFVAVGGTISAEEGIGLALVDTAVRVNSKLLVHHD